jgi:DNA-binding MarR family transcriptional regulator
MPTSTVRSSPAAREAWGLVWEIFVADKPRRAAIMGALGLSMQQAMALGSIDAEEPIPMSRLAGLLHCDNSNVTGIVDRLEAAGLAERRPHAHDRRVKVIALTGKGRRLREELQRRAGEPPLPLASLSEEDAAALRDILARAIAAGAAARAADELAAVGR